jgi:predicted DNA-binding protein
LWHIEEMKRESTFNFRLPRSLKSRLDAFCAARGITKADLCVTALGEFLDSIEKLDSANLVSRVYPPVDIQAMRAAENPTANKPRRSAGA